MQTEFIQAGFEGMTDSFNNKNNGSRIPDDIDLNEAGKEILNAVSRAVETGDFSQLNAKLNRTVGSAAKSAVDAVDSAVDSVADAISGAAQDFMNPGRGYQPGSSGQRGQRAYQQTTPPPTSTSFRGSGNRNTAGNNAGGPNRGPGNSGNRGPGSYAGANAGRAGETMTDQWVRNHNAQTRSQSQQRQAQMDEEMRRKEAQRTPFFNPFTNRSRGKLKSIFGLIGTIGNGVLAGMTLIGLITTAIVTGSSTAVGILILVLNFFLIMLAVFLILLATGKKEQKLTEKYFNYAKFAGSAEYLAIADFARRIGVPAKTLVKDLRAMIKKGFLPSARIDERETTLMLTDNAYKMYLDATDSEAARQRRQQQDFVKQQAANAKKAKQQAADDAAYADLPEDVAAILREGRAYVRDVREINDRIPDTEEMSTKLYRLEDVMNKIFAKVQSDPSLAPSLRRFMSYYLPTTKKLLEAYVDLSNQPGVENITKTKQEIDQAMDTINDAYEKLLNDLFQNDAWDVSSDISVMQTMMAQDGLTEGPAAKAKSGRPAGTPAGKVTEKAREKVPVLAGADSSTGTADSQPRQQAIPMPEAAQPEPAAPTPAQPEPEKEQGIPQPELVFGVPEEARIDEE